MKHFSADILSLATTSLQHPSLTLYLNSCSDRN